MIILECAMGAAIVYNGDAWEPCPRRHSRKEDPLEPLFILSVFHPSRNLETYCSGQGARGDLKHTGRAALPMTAAGIVCDPVALTAKTRMTRSFALMALLPRARHRYVDTIGETPKEDAAFVHVADLLRVIHG